MDEIQISEYDFFFSYSRDTYSSIAIELIDVLEAYHLRLWVDKTEVPLGCDVCKNINNVLNEVQYWKGAILLLDHSYWKKEWCLKELDIFLQQKTKILPLLYNQNKSDIPAKYSILKGINVAYLRTSKDINFAVNKILDQYLKLVKKKEKILSINHPILTALVKDFYYCHTNDFTSLIKISNIAKCIELCLQKKEYIADNYDRILFSIIKNKMNGLFAKELIDRQDFLLSKFALSCLLKRFNVVSDVFNDFEN